MKTKYLSTAILSLFFIDTQTQESKSKKSSAYISLYTDTFLSIQPKIESEETGKILGKYTHLGVSFSLNYMFEKTHLFYPAGLAGRIFPIGHQFTIKKKDRFDK